MRRRQVRPAHRQRWHVRQCARSPLRTSYRRRVARSSRCGCVERLRPVPSPRALAQTTIRMYFRSGHPCNACFRTRAECDFRDARCVRRDETSQPAFVVSSSSTGRPSVANRKRACCLMARTSDTAPTRSMLRGAPKITSVSLPMPWRLTDCACSRCRSPPAGSGRVTWHQDATPSDLLRAIRTVDHHATRMAASDVPQWRLPNPLSDYHLSLDSCLMPTFELRRGRVLL